MKLDVLEKEGVKYRFANSNDKDSIYAFALDALQVLIYLLLQKMQVIISNKE